MSERHVSQLWRRKTVSWSEACLLLELDDVGLAEWLREDFARNDSDARILPFVELPYPGIPARAVPSFSHGSSGYQVLNRAAEFWRRVELGPVLKRSPLASFEVPDGVFPPEAEQHGVAWRKTESPDGTSILKVSLSGRLFLSPETLREALSSTSPLVTIFAAPLEWQCTKPAWPLMFAFEPMAGVPRLLTDAGVRFATHDLRIAKSRIDLGPRNASMPEAGTAQQRAANSKKEREMLHLLICALIEIAQRPDPVPLHQIRTQVANQIHGKLKESPTTQTIRNYIDFAEETAKLKGWILRKRSRKSDK